MKCYLCNKSNLNVIRRKLRYNIRRNVLKCKNCGLIYLEPKNGNLQDYYSGEYRKKYKPVIGKALTSKENFDICLPLQRARIDEIKHILNKNMRVLDVGCSSGFFLYSLKDYVMECIGIEFNKEDANFVSNELRIKTYRERIENTDIPLHYFDLITFFHSLEHMDDPVGTLTTIRRYLKPSGYVCIEVPNIQDALLSVYNIKPYTDFWFREPHIFYFSPKTLLMTTKKSGFEGKLKSIMAYNFINHMNWVLTGKPQKSLSIGMSKPKLADLDDSIVGRKLNDWILRVDKEYKDILNKYNAGDSIMFIGKAKK